MRENSVSFFSLWFLVCFHIFNVFVFRIDTWELALWFLQVTKGSVGSYIMIENMKSFIQFFKQFFVVSALLIFFLCISVSIHLSSILYFKIYLQFWFSKGFRVYTTNYRTKGGKVLKKPWYCVGGEYYKNIWVLSIGLIMWIGHRKEIRNIPRIFHDYRKRKD